MEKPKLTQYSKGSGCGCKIAPTDLESILKNISNPTQAFSNLLVGNGRNDDAAVMDIGNNQCVISTTDFFTPIVDDAHDFGKIAAANAISDIYAMGGKPIMAVGILGWPIEALGPELAAEVISGAQSICLEANIPLAGGHSIDSKEPFFGLAVTGLVEKVNLKGNNTAQKGDIIYTTKPIGAGILSSGMKRGLINDEANAHLVSELTKLNRFGSVLGNAKGVTAVTDITGFGLLGHLIEICEASNTQAEIHFEKVPVYDLELLKPLLDQFVMPDNTMRNFKAYSSKVNKLDAKQLQLLCDPQTNGGLLFTVEKNSRKIIEDLAREQNTPLWEIGRMYSENSHENLISII